MASDNFKITANELSSTVSRLLNEYGDQCVDKIRTVSKIKAQKGAKEVRKLAKSKFKGNLYAKGWTSKTTNTRFGAEAVIYNKSHYQLAHLLEHGHALVIGGRSRGRVAGREHIAPVNDSIQKDFEKTLVEELNK